MPFRHLYTTLRLENVYAVFVNLFLAQYGKYIIKLRIIIMKYSCILSIRLNININIHIRKKLGNWEFTTFPLWLRVFNFDILESALSFWLLFMHIFFKRDLKCSLFSRIFSSVRFSMILLFKTISGNDSLKPRVSKWPLSGL